MKFMHRVFLSLALPALVVLCAGVAVAWGAWSLQRAMSGFFEQDDALAESALEMYAQGLQMELAVRNILLNPAGQRAHDNLQTARGAFDEALGKAQRSANSAQESGLIAGLQPLRASLNGKQQAALLLVRSDQAAAVDLLNKEETPAWRELRAQLLELKQLAAAGKASQRASAERVIGVVKLVAILVAALCTLACVLNSGLLQRRLDSELGGDPGEARRTLRQVAAGDLQVRVPVRAGDSSSLMAAISQTQASLRQLVAEMVQVAKSIDTAVHEIATGNLDLSTRTERQASSLQETAASIEQLSAMVQQNTESAQAVTTLADQANTVAQQGGDAVRVVVQTMGAVNSQSQKIAEITSVIDNIAFQTNILALNAAVESARAGEHGRGFAVVASEVRSLAQRSAQAAREIGGLVAENVSQVDIGARQVKDAGQTMDEIVSRVGRVNGLINEIALASREQNTGLGQINQAVAQLDEATQQNAALVEQSSAASESLLQQVGHLTRLASVFRV